MHKEQKKGADINLVNLYLKLSMKKYSNNKGITFIALIVTIIVLLIILSISMAVLTGDNGIVKRTEEAKVSKNKSEEKEAIKWASAQAVADSDIGKITKDKLKEYLDSYIGDDEDNAFEYEIDDSYNGIFVVEFTVSKNRYTIDDNGNVYEDTDENNQDKRDGIVVNPSNATINVGETIPLTFTTKSDKDKITWSSENEGIAKVDKDGNVTGMSNGKVTITVTTERGKKAECYITVQTKPTGLEVSPTEKIVDLSSTDRLVPLTTKIIPDTANVFTGITWSSSNPDVAEVDGNGLVTAKTNGEAIITATTENEISATSTITVQSSPTGLNLNYTNATLDITEDPTMTLTAKSVSDTANINKNITWTSSNPAIAEVRGSGENAVVTARSNGETKIIATTENGKTATCAVTVQTSPTGVTLNKTSATLDLSGTKTVQLSATISPNTANANTGLTWTSSNSSIATVNGSGLVTGVKNGTTVITVKTANGKEAKCNVVVQTSITGLSVSPTSAEIQPGQTIQLTAAKTPASATEGLTWTSSNTSVATVNSSGLVTGKGNGTVTITVKNSRGTTSATCTITCLTKYTISFDPNSGTGAPASQIKKHGIDLTLSNVVPTRANYKFLGWATSATGAVVYGSGATYKENANITLYARWSPLPLRIFKQRAYGDNSFPTGWNVCHSETMFGELLYISSITGYNTDSLTRGVFIGAGGVLGNCVVGGRIEGYNGTTWVTLWENTENTKGTLTDGNWCLWRENISANVNGWYSGIRCLYYFEKNFPLSVPWMTFDFDVNF